MTLQTNFYFTSPLEVARVTPKNLEEVAAWCGGKVAETESRRVPGRMDKYVWVPTPKGASVSWAFPGMYITKRVVITEKEGDIVTTFSVFRKDYFKKNYFDSIERAVDETWERQARESKTTIQVKQKTPTSEPFVVVTPLNPGHNPPSPMAEQNVRAHENAVESNGTVHNV